MSHTLLDAAKDMTGEDVQMEDLEFVKTFPQQVKTLVRHLQNDTANIGNESLETCVKSIQLANYLNFQTSYNLLEQEIVDRMSENNLCFIQTTLPKPMFEQLLIRKNDLELVLLSDNKHIISKIRILYANYYAKVGKLLSLKYCLEIQGDTLNPYIMNHVSENGRLPIVQFLHNIGIGCTIHAMDRASENGHLLVVQFIHSIGKDCTVYAMDHASTNGHLCVLQFLHSIGKNFTTAPMDLASGNGHLLLVQFLRSVGKKCTTYAMDLASERGHLTVVQFLHSISKKCTNDAMDRASDNGYLSVVQFLHSVGKRFTPRATKWASTNNHSSIVEFLHNIDN